MRLYNDIGKTRQKVLVAIAGLVLICCCGCLDSKILYVEHTLPVPTTLPSNEIILCFSKDLEKYKPYVYSQSRSRFKRFVAVMYKGKDDGEWKGASDVDEFLVKDIVFATKNECKGYDVLLFIDNPGRKSVDGAFYFKGNVFSDNGLNYSIWDMRYNE